MPIIQPNLFLSLVLAAGLCASGCTSKTAQAYAEGQRAQALFDSGDLPGARRAIDRALAQRDDQIDLLLLDGRIKFQMEEYKAAFDSFDLALAIDPNNAEALQAVSQIGASIGNTQESAAATSRILAMDPANASALLVKGVEHIEKRDYADAQSTGERMLRVDPQSEAGLVLRARAIFLAGRQQEAIGLLKGALERAGPTKMIATALLECARDQGDTQLMIEQFRTLSELAPSNVDLTIDEANVNYKRGDLDGARSRGRALITENGGDYAAMQRLGELWAEYDRDPLDRAGIDALTADGPAPARLMAARRYLATGDARTAEQLVRSLTGDVAAGLRARIAYAAGKDGGAAAAERVLATDNTNCDALVVREAAALRRNLAGEAVIAAQVIAAECPDRDDGFVLLAQAYQVKRNDAGVRRAYLEGIRARPLSTALVARYTDWLITAGQGTSAVEFARRLTQRAPAKVSAWRLFAVTCGRVPQAGCAAEARAGEARARNLFVIDLQPGERHPNPLLGHSWQ